MCNAWNCSQSPCPSFFPHVGSAMLGRRLPQPSVCINDTSAFKHHLTATWLHNSICHKPKHMRTSATDSPLEPQGRQDKSTPITRATKSPLESAPTHTAWSGPNREEVALTPARTGNSETAHMETRRRAGTSSSCYFAVVCLVGPAGGRGSETWAPCHSSYCSESRIPMAK